MTFPRFGYRARQFWNALLRPELRVQTAAIQAHLFPSQLILFRQMQPSEQAHAYHVFEHLRRAGNTDADLLAAALLHDVGKIFSPLSVFDRVMIVTGKYLFPKAFKRWGEGAPRGLRRPFVVAVRHGEWGADLVQKTGASSLTVELVRRHHERFDNNPISKTEQLLIQLHKVDDQY